MPSEPESNNNPYGDDVHIVKYEGEAREFHCMDCARVCNYLNECYCCDQAMLLADKVVRHKQIQDHNCFFSFPEKVQRTFPKNVLPPQWNRSCNQGNGAGKASCQAGWEMFPLPYYQAAWGGMVQVKNQCSAVESEILFFRKNWKYVELAGMWEKSAVDRECRSRSFKAHHWAKANNKFHMNFGPHVSSEPPTSIRHQFWP